MVTLPHITPVRIYYEDTDAAGVVYYANYLRYLERARCDLLREMGYELAALMDDGVIFPVRDVHVRYRAPARLGDRIEVRTHRLTQPTPASLVFEADVYLEATKLIASRVECACIDGGGRLRRIPAALAQAVQALASAEA